MRSFVAGIACVSLVLAVAGATLPGPGVPGAPGGPAIPRSPGSTVSAAIAAPGSAQDHAAGRSVQDGVFSAEQAERGRQVFDSSCFECHPLEEFQDPFLATWEGATVYALFEQLRTTMPYERPDTLEQQEYVDVLAYIFRANGLPTGEGELEPEQEGLERIVIEGPFGESEGGR